jgi:hypothetical protein
MPVRNEWPGFIVSVNDTLYSTRLNVPTFHRGFIISSVCVYCLCFIIEIDSFVRPVKAVSNLFY